MVLKSSHTCTFLSWWKDIFNPLENFKTYFVQLYGDLSNTGKKTFTVVNKLIMKKTLQNSFEDYCDCWTLNFSKEKGKCENVTASNAKILLVLTLKDMNSI